MTAARLLADAPLRQEQLLKLTDDQRARLAAAATELSTLLAPRVNVASELDLARLAATQRSLTAGAVPAGRQVFFGRKASCSACHRVGQEGGKIGPDLSKVGERRSPRDLLEAVVLPNSSIARGYESHAIRTTDGRTLTGLIVRETADSVFLRTLDQRELRLARGDIDQMQSSPTSIMPSGLDTTLSRQELADLLAYLQSLK